MTVALLGHVRSIPVAATDPMRNYQRINRTTVYVYQMVALLGHVQSIAVAASDYYQHINRTTVYVYAS